MRLVLPALFFAAHYVLMMALCGAIVWRMLAPRRKAGPTNSAGPEPSARLAIFLIGTGFAPFVIGLLQGSFWIVVPHLHVRAYAAIQWTIVIAGLLILRKSLFEIGQEVGKWINRDGSTRFGTFLVLATLGFAAVFAGGHALQPQRHYDTTTYALDARRLATERDWSAMLPAGAPIEPDNQFANHNHGASYQAYLSASLLYRSKTHQDLPVRVAQQALAVHGVILTIGLALRFGGLVAVLAPLLLLLYPWWGHMIGSASRDFYRIIPFLLSIGLFRTQGVAPGFNAQGLLLCVAFAFLWNSHASSLMIAPLLAAGMCVVSVRPLAVMTVLLACAIGAALGASHLIRAAIETGDPLAYSPIYNVNYEGTAVVEPWLAARNQPEPGLSNAWQKLTVQFNSDGGPVSFEPKSFRKNARTILLDCGLNIVVLTWLSIIAFCGVVGTRLVIGRNGSRAPWPPAPAWLIAGILLVSELLLIGAADWIKPQISPTFSMNARYRAHLYPIASVLIALMIQQCATPLLRRRVGSLRNLAGLGACGLAMFLALDRWSKPAYPPQPNTEKANAYLANQVPYYEWARYFRHIDRDELIVMDYAYLGWYQTENRIMFTQDPRLREAFIADDPARVIQFFDGLGVRYLYLIDLERTAILESEIALAHAIQSSAFELIVEFPGAWYLYRRADEPSETEFEISDGLAVDSIGRGAWTVVQDLAPGLRADSFRDREQAAATLLQLGPEAAKAIRWFSRKSTDAPSRRWCLKIARTIESESFTAMDALRSLRAFDGKRFARATDPDHPFTGPQLADQLQIIATLRGVSIADSAQGFFTKIVERSAAANDGYRVVLEDGSRRDLVEWLTEQITPAVESGAESG